MSDSILNSIKKTLGIAQDYTIFDVDVLMHINSVLAVLTQVGIGPEEGFLVEDATATWTDFAGENNQLNMVRSYVYARVRLLFDPPTTSFHLEAAKNMALELEWRLNVVREGELWETQTA